MMEKRRPLSLPDLARAKAQGEKIAMISVADVLTAAWAERAGADMVVVGDSLAMTVYGHANTLPLTLDQMIAHTQAVRRGAPGTLCLAAMPYGTYPSIEIAVVNALRLMKESGADAVKIQGGRAKAPILAAIAHAGVPVMGHIGMCPHHIHSYGGFKLQGRTAEAAVALVKDAQAMEGAGAVGIEVEAVPAPVGAEIEARTSVFTFGIGAGAATTGQILLGVDMLGMFDSFKPRFAKRYADFAGQAVAALEAYAAEVREGHFPYDEHSYPMNATERDRMAALLGSRHQKDNEVER